MWDIQIVCDGRVGRGLPVLAAPGMRTDISHHLPNHRLFGRHVVRSSGLQIDRIDGVDVNESLCGEDFAAFTIDDVQVTIAVGVGQHLAVAAADLGVQEHVLVDPVIVIQIVWVELIEPLRRPGVCVSREDAGGPLVVSRSLVRVPRTRIGRAVIDQVQARIVGNPAPYRATAPLPGIRWPRLHAEVGATIALVVWIEVRANEHFGVRPRAVGSPKLLAAGDIQSREPAPYTELSAAVADQNLVFHHERRHGHGLAAADVAQARSPQLRSGVCIDGNGAPIQRVEEQASVGVGRAAINAVTARHSLRRGARFRLVLPFQWSAGLVQR